MSHNYRGGRPGGGNNGGRGWQNHKDQGKAGQQQRGGPQQNNWQQQQFGGGRNNFQQDDWKQSGRQQFHQQGRGGSSNRGGRNVQPTNFDPFAFSGSTATLQQGSQFQQQRGFSGGSGRNTHNLQNNFQQRSQFNPEQGGRYKNNDRGRGARLDFRNNISDESASMDILPSYPQNQQQFGGFRNNADNGRRRPFDFRQNIGDPNTFGGVPLGKSFKLQSQEQEMNYRNQSKNFLSGGNNTHFDPFHSASTSTGGSDLFLTNNAPRNGIVVNKLNSRAPDNFQGNTGYIMDDGDMDSNYIQDPRVVVLDYENNDDYEHEVDIGESGDSAPEILLVQEEDEKDTITEAMQEADKDNPFRDILNRGPPAKKTPS
jgi:hypothetical protein